MGSYGWLVFSAFLVAFVGVCFWTLVLGPEGGRRVSPPTRGATGGAIVVAGAWIFIRATSGTYQPGLSLAALRSLIEPPLWCAGWVLFGLVAGMILGMLTDPRDDGD